MKSSSRRTDSHNPSLEVEKALTPVAPSSSSSKFWMYERCFAKTNKANEYECLLARTSSYDHETIVKIGNDKSRLKKHVLTHHKGLNLISYESKSSNSRTAKEVDSLIEDYNKNGASPIENFFETKPQSANPPERDFAL